jgi:hypothetical protein
MVARMTQVQPQQQPWFFDADGWTRYPLFHGTSTYFMDSIRAHGLGGRNIIREWRAVEMYRELALRRSRQAPVAYNHGGGWGYGDTYLTGYPDTARRFFKESELFGLIRADLRGMRRVKRDELLSHYPEIAAYLASKHRPVVLQLPRLHKSTLLGRESDDPCGSMGDLESYEMAMTTPGIRVPRPTFRLRGATFDFEIVD